jgi:GMP synthase (glutamine-hydrolysing)
VQPDADTEGFTQYRGIILSGGPHSVLDPDGPTINPEILSLDIPVLGLCYGHQLIAKLLGGKVSQGEKREYGIAALTVTTNTSLFKDLSEREQIWMSHGDAVDVPPEGFDALGSTADCPFAAMGDVKRNIFGLQFHPEVTDTPKGMTILSNFLDICGCERTWSSDAFLMEKTEKIRNECRDKKVFLLVSGGVDSTVTFTLLNKALGAEHVLGLHIDNGLMRLEESENIIVYLKNHGFRNLHIYDAVDDFLNALQGVSNPEEKRTIIGNKFLEVQEKAQQGLGLSVDEWILAQGTIYPDTIESAGTKHADKIKTHHNRVDIILELIEKGLIIEPLSQLYKDEVRQLGEILGIPHDLLWRHPFPGPGLGVRLLCSDGKEEPTNEEALKNVSVIAEPSGYTSYILPIKSVGVQGDSRTYTQPVLLTGEKDWPLLETISTKITNTIREVNRVLFGISVQENPHYSLIEGYLTKQRLDKLRAIDHLVNVALHLTGEYDSVWQMPVVLLPLVNSNGDECVVLRPIASQEAMTARFFPLKDETLQKIVEGARDIDGIGDIFYDITNKPPGTIEWE